MKRLVLAALILTTAVGASAQFTSTDTLKYRISLTDKAATTYSCLLYTSDAADD